MADWPNDNFKIHTARYTVAPGLNEKRATNSVRVQPPVTARPTYQLPTDPRAAVAATRAFMQRRATPG